MGPCVRRDDTGAPFGESGSRRIPGTAHAMCDDGHWHRNPAKNPPPLVAEANRQAGGSVTMSAGTIVRLRTYGTVATTWR